MPEQRPAASLDEIEEACLEADAWADALDEWAAPRAHLPIAADATSLSGMLRALVRPLRLSLLVEDGESDRRCLLEEVRSGIGMAQSFGARHRRSSTPGAGKDSSERGRVRTPAVEVLPASMATPANGQYRVSNPWKDPSSDLPALGRVALTAKGPRGPRR